MASETSETPTTVSDEGAGADSATSATAGDAPKAAGIGTAVAFDWGLSAEFLTFVVLYLAGIRAGFEGVPGAVVLLALLLGVALFGALGEALRRGYRQAWMAQLAINILLLPGGLILLLGTISDIGHHHFGGIIPNAILLFVDPVLVWLLTRARTRAWLRATTPAAAMARHGGRWVAVILGYSVILGALVALGAYY